MYNGGHLYCPIFFFNSLNFITQTIYIYPVVPIFNMIVVKTNETPEANALLLLLFNINGDNCVILSFHIYRERFMVSIGMPLTI